MAHMTEEMLTEWSKTAAVALVEEGVPLLDSLAKIAEDRMLNPEQVRRLVEGANTATFLMKFNSVDEGNDDRLVSFETADPEAVIGRLMDGAKDYCCAKTASADDPADFSAPLDVSRPGAKREEVKEAAYTPLVERTTRPKKHVVLRRLIKTARELEISVAQARQKQQDDFAKLAGQFRRMNGPSHDVFEKDAFYLHGTAAVPHLALLRKALRKETAVYDAELNAKVARVVDAQTPEHEALKGLMNTSETITLGQKAIEKLQKDIADVSQ